MTDNNSTYVPPVSGFLDSSQIEERNKEMSRLQSEGKYPYSDGIFRKNIPCKVVDFYNKWGLFGRKYYFVLNLNGVAVHTIRVNETDYYNNRDISEIGVSSTDGENWNFIRN
jgi:hypothetical protein